MIQQPPPAYNACTPGHSAQYTTLQETTVPLPLKSGAPLQAAYGANPVHQTSSTTGPTVTTTTTRQIVQQQPPAVIYTTTPGYGFRHLPVNMQCPTCQSQIVTATEFTPGSLSWLACCGLAAMGAVLGCCFIPFCIDDMKDVTHSCPNCHTVVGIYNRL